MCESKIDWVTPPVTECNDENSRGLLKTRCPSGKGSEIVNISKFCPSLLYWA